MLPAVPLYASSGVAPPLWVDRRRARDTAVLRAVLTRWSAVQANPGVLTRSAALLLGLTRPAMLPAQLPTMDFTKELIDAFGMSFGVGALMLSMMFIVLQVARESKAGKFGTFVLSGSRRGVDRLRR